MNSKLKMIIVSGVLIVISVAFGFLGNEFQCNELFKFNIMEIITAILAAFGIWYLTEINDSKNRKNKKIEEIVELLRNKLNDVFKTSIKKEKHAEYLNAFKYVDNKIRVLKKLCNELSCGEEIKTIESKKGLLDDFINENISQGTRYFEREEVKYKVPNILCDIETQLDNIILKIYK